MTAEPPAAEEILGDNHAGPDDDGIGDAQTVVARQAIAAEDEGADDGLQQVVGETHAAEEAEMTEHPAHAREGIPGGNHGRDNHEQDEEVVDGVEPRGNGTVGDHAQHRNGNGGANEDGVPRQQVVVLMVEQPVPPQLHAKDEEAEQLRETAAEDVETQVHLEAVAQVGEGVLPERAVLVGIVDDGGHLIEPGMVDLGAREQAEQLDGLDGEQGDDAPHPSGRQVADGDEQQPVAGVEHEDVAIVEGHIDHAKEEQQEHAPGEAAREAAMLLLLVVVHDKETQTEEHGEDAVHLTAEQPGEHLGHHLVGGQRMGNRFLREDVEVLDRVIQDDAGHGDASQGVGHVDAGVWDVPGVIHFADFPAKIHIIAGSAKFLEKLYGKLAFTYGLSASRRRLSRDTSSEPR